MSNITANISVRHQGAGSTATNSANRISAEESFSIDSLEFSTTAVALTPSTVITPKDYFVRNLSGDDMLVSLDNDSTYPLAVPAGEATLISLDVAGSAETSTVVAEADIYADLSAKYFDLTDRAGSVRVWFNTGVFAKVTLTMDTQPADGDTMTIGARTYTWQSTLTNVDGNIWIGADLAAAKLNLGYAIAATGGTSGTDYAAAMTANTQVFIGAFATNDAIFTALTVGVAGNALVSTETFTAGTNVFSAVTLTGGLAESVQPAGSPNRFLPVVLVPNSTAIVNAVAIALALTTDDEFTSAVPTTATLTVIDQHAGTRTDIADGDTTWTVATTQQGAALPVVFAKSKGTSQAQIMVVPF
jgi:hypothetical protein